MKTAKHTSTEQPPAQWEKDVEDLARYRALFPRLLRDLQVHTGMTETAIRNYYNAKGL